MAENQSQSDEQQSQSVVAYWCYQCESEVVLEPANMVCSVCRNGFVEAVDTAQGFRARANDTSGQRHNPRIDDASYRRHVLRVLRVVARASSRATPPRNLNVNDDDEEEEEEEERQENSGSVVGVVDSQREDVEENQEFFAPEHEEDGEGEGFEDSVEGENVLNIELDAWDSFDDDDEEDDEDEDEEEDAWEEVNEGENVEEEEEQAPQEEENANAENINNDNPTEGNGNNRGRTLAATAARRRDVLRLRIRDWNAQAGGARLESSGRVLDWNEILRGLEDNTIELRLSLPEEDTYIGNPEDYVDDAGFEILLQNLAESDDAHRGAPPASKSAVEGLPSVVITKENVDSGAALCAICKDVMQAGQTEKKMPCCHLYHGDCIVPWLNSRNSCPICRFELPTDDADYEEQRKQRATRGSSRNSAPEGEHSS